MDELKPEDVMRASEEFADYQADVQMEIADARVEAIDEFAERLKKTLIEGGIYPVLVKNSIDKIAKELKGEV